MKSSKEIVQTYILQSSLSLTDKAEFSDFLLRADDDELAPVAALFGKDANWVMKLFHNYKDKKAAIDSRDARRWKKILDEEVEALRSGV